MDPCASCTVLARVLILPAERLSIDQFDPITRWFSRIKGVLQTLWGLGIAPMKLSIVLMHNGDRDPSDKYPAKSR